MTRLILFTQSALLAPGQAKACTSDVRSECKTLLREIFVFVLFFLNIKLVWDDHSSYLADLFLKILPELEMQQQQQQRRPNEKVSAYLQQRLHQSFPLRQGAACARIAHFVVYEWHRGDLSRVWDSTWGRQPFTSALLLEDASSGRRRLSQAQSPTHHASPDSLQLPVLKAASAAAGRLQKQPGVTT